VLTRQRFERQQAVKSQIAEAQKMAAGSGSEQDIAEAKVELEVCYSCYLFAAFLAAENSVNIY
jgi:hypothetical protein